MDTMQTGRFLASLRREKHLTQEQLGEKLGVTNKTISRWETGSYLPGVDMLQLLSKEFDVSIGELLAGERLTTENYREKTDAALSEVLQQENFTIKERYAYWEGKWKREHKLFRISFPAAALVLLAAGMWFQNQWLLMLAALAGLLGHMIINNRKMAYIERHTFEE